MSIKPLRLKKGHDRRIRSGHPWVFSNEIDTSITPLKTFQAGEEVIVETHDGKTLGVAYINPRSLITARLFSRDIDARLNEDWLTKRFQDALALREHLFEKPYYRLVFSEADNVPGLVIDRFGNDLVVQINTAGMEHHQEHIANALLAILPETNSILLRNDSKIREQEGLETYVKPLYGSPPDEIKLEENGVTFIAPLFSGQKTGWFYDHRMNRARLANYVKNRTVLDVFSYLGGFGIQAACFGATSVDCIDSSRPACEFIEKNAVQNHVADKVHVLCDDAFDALKTLCQAGKTYDVIILDPPAFVKKAKDHNQGLLAYQRLNESALKLLAPGGILVSCSCSMHVSEAELIEMMQRLAYRTQSTLQLLERGHQGPDHPVHILINETNYLKALYIRKSTQPSPRA